MGPAAPPLPTCPTRAPRGAAARFLRPAVLGRGPALLPSPPPAGLAGGCGARRHPRAPPPSARQLRAPGREGAKRGGAQGPGSPSSPPGPGLWPRPPAPSSARDWNYRGLRQCASSDARAVARPRTPPPRPLPPGQPGSDLRRPADEREKVEASPGLPGGRAPRSLSPKLVFLRSEPQAGYHRPLKVDWGKLRPASPPPDSGRGQSRLPAPGGWSSGARRSGGGTSAFRPPLRPCPGAPEPKPLSGWVRARRAILSDLGRGEGKSRK